MKNLFVSTLLAGVVAVSASVASAQATIIDENFDSYADTAALTGVWTVDSPGATLKTDGGHSGSNYVQTGTTASGKLSQSINVTPTDDAPVEVSAWARLGGAASGRSYLQIEGASLNMADLGQYNNPGGNKWNYRAGAPGTWKNAGPTQVANQWYNLKIVMQEQAAIFYVDDVEIARETRTVAWNPMTKFSFGFAGSSVITVDWDDITVKTVSSVSDWNLY